MKVDGELRLLEEEIVLDKKYKHDISVVVDRLIMRPDLRKRLADSVETAVALADGIIEIETVPRDGSRAGGHDATPSASPACTAGSRCPSSSRARSRSTRRTAPARAAPGSARRWRSTRSSWCRTRRCRSTRARSCRGRAGATNYYDQITQAIAERYEIDLDAPWEDLPRGAAGPVPVRHQRRPDLRLLPQPDGPQAVVHDDLRGDRPQPRAPLQGDGLRLVAREDRGVHVGAAVPGVQGRAAAAGVARGQGRRAGDPRVHAPERAARAGVARGARAVRARTARSRG